MFREDCLYPGGAGQHRVRSYTQVMRGFFLVLLGVSWLGIVGCESVAPTHIDPFAIAPMDLSIDVSILVGESVTDRSAAHLRPSRYMLLPDGSLRFSEVTHNRPVVMPELARRLNRRQVADLWSLAKQIGFADPANGSRMTSFRELQPGPNEIVYVIMFKGMDRRWEFVRRSDAGHVPDPASVQFIRKFAQYAWAADFSREMTVILPQHYDFGPDPYARYRE